MCMFIYVYVYIYIKYMSRGEYYCRDVVYEHKDPTSYGFWNRPEVLGLSTTMRYPFGM